MSPTDTATDLLDLEISLAFITLGGARSVWGRCPSAWNARRVAEAETELNGLLEQRLAAGHTVAR